MWLEKIDKNRLQTLIFLDIAKKVQPITLISEVRISPDAMRYATALLIKAISEALKEYPHLNAMMKYGSHTSLIRLSDINARVTVSFGNKTGRSGVYTYSIHHTDAKDVQEIQDELTHIKENTIYHSEFHKKIKKMQKLPLFLGKILAKLMLMKPARQAEIFGSFTVTSMGRKSQLACIPISGSTYTFMMGSPKHTVALPEDEGKNRHVCNIIMVFDHRVLDGIEAADFLNRIKENFQNYEKGLNIIR